MFIAQNIENKYLICYNDWSKKYFIFDCLYKSSDKRQFIQNYAFDSVYICPLCGSVFSNAILSWEHFYHNHIKQNNL